MALDTVEGIHEYRDQVADKALDDPRAVVGMGAGTMLKLLDTLFEELEHWRTLAETGRQPVQLESARVVPLRQRRRTHALQEAPDLISYE